MRCSRSAKPRPPAIRSSNSSSRADEYRPTTRGAWLRLRSPFFMRPHRATMKSAAHIVVAIVVSGLAAGVMASAGQLPIEPAKQSGTGITPAYEGWYDNPDGSHNFLVGYLNRNRALELD